MSATTVTIWRCDRCDKEVTMSEREQPPQWYRLTKSRPPLASPTEVDSKSRADWQVCRECSEDFHDWLLTDPMRHEATTPSAEGK